MHNMIIIVFVLVNVNIIINKLYGINNNKEKIYVLKVKNVNIFYLQFHLREYQKKKMNINVYKFVVLKINNLFGMIKDITMMLIVQNMINARVIM